MTRKLGIISATLLLTATVAYGVQLKLSLDEISQTADLIFIGTAESQSSRLTATQNAIQTDVVFRDVQVVHSTGASRQRAESTISLSYAGGQVGSVAMNVSDTPSFTIGRRYLIFMHDDGPTYLNPIIGGSQGLFEVIKDAVTNQEYVLTAGGRAVLGLDNRGNVQASSVKAAAIRSGVIIGDASRQNERAGAEQTAQAVSAGASVDAGSVPPALVDQTPLPLQSLIETITTESLKRPINNPLLNRDGVGQFYREVDGQIRAEAIKTTAPRARRLSQMAQRKAPIIEPGSVDLIGEIPQRRIDTQGSTLYYCGNRGRPFNMEQVPTAWWEWWVNNNSMWNWNQYVDLFRYIPDDGTFGWRNGTNEFDGYPSSATMQAIYGYTWGASTLAVTISYTINGMCGTIMETDVAWNPAKSWTDNYLFAFNNSGIVNQMPVTLHELGHTHGLQRAAGELYDYDLPSAMHAYYFNVAEDGWGVHAADTANTRANYGSSTGIADIGVESYYASNGLNLSWTNASLYRPGNTITVNNITVENMSDYALGNVHIRLYLSTNQTISTGDQLIGDWFWSSFCGPCYNVGSYTTSIPTDTPPGTYWVGALMTINGYGSDGMTANNTTFLTNQITVTCSDTFSMNPSSAFFLKGGGSASVGVNTTGSACSWSASTNASWVHITSGSSGTGNGTIGYTVDANVGAARSGYIFAGGASHFVSQEAGCLATTASALGFWAPANAALSGADCLSQLRTISGMKPYAERYTFSGAAGQKIALLLTSGDFDTYIYLLDPGGALVAQNDDGGGGTNSRIPATSGLFTLPAAGTYTVEVTSYAVGATGNYSLTLLGEVLLTVTPDPVTGACKDAKGKLTLGAPAPTGGLVLNVSDTLANATTPATVTVAAGTLAKAFAIATSAAPADQAGSVAAAFGGAFGVAASDSLTVRAISVKDVTLTPNPVKGGNPVAGVVTLECAAGPGDITVTLSSNKPALASPSPASVVIPLGASTATFSVTTTKVGTQSAATIKATANGRFKSEKLVINP